MAESFAAFEVKKILIGKKIISGIQSAIHGVIVPSIAIDT